MGVAVLALTVLLLAGMLFGVAAVSVGHGNALSEPSVDRRELVLPADTITAGTLESLRFTMALRGYRMDEVDTVLDRLSAELSVRDAEIGRLRAAAGVVASAPGTSDDARQGLEAPGEHVGAFQGAEVPPPAFAPPEGLVSSSESSPYGAATFDAATFDAPTYAAPTYGAPTYGASYDAPAYEPPAPYEGRPEASGPEASGPERPGG